VLDRELISKKSTEERLRLKQNCERLLGDPRQPAKLKEQARHALTILGEVEQVERGQAAANRERAQTKAVADQDRIVAELMALPRKDRIVEVFRRIKPMTDLERKVVQALVDNPIAEAEELSKAAGWNGKIWQTYFGSMCRDREAYLWPAPPLGKVKNADGEPKPFFSGILLTFDEDAHVFRMKPETAAAFEELGFRPSRKA
jgi:hypothetical protein